LSAPKSGKDSFTNQAHPEMIARLNITGGSQFHPLLCLQFFNT